MTVLRIAALCIAAVAAFTSAHAANQARMGGGHFGVAHQGGGRFVGGQPGIAHFRGGGGPFVRPGPFGRPGPFVGPGGFRGNGRFFHGFHGGRFGWWFISAGVWVPWVVPVAVPVAVPVSSAWYFCQSAGTYYPWVSFCPEGWVLTAPPWN